jgi:RND family efflux transporter MFP subunit
VAAGLWSLLALVGACSAPPSSEEVLRPVRSEIVVVSDAGRARTFSGTAHAGQEIDLSFRVGGRVERLPLEVGDAVRTGQLLGQLETTDHEIAVRQAEASRDKAAAESRRADADLERVRGLYESDGAAQGDLDQALAKAQSARAQVVSATQSLARAQRQLDYTSLRSPVDGLVAAVYVEVNENVQAGRVIARLTSGSQAQVEVAIPEVLISEIREGDPVGVSFDALPGRRFDALVTEVGVAATGAATTFPVTVRLSQATEDVRSGMAADVTFRFEEAGSQKRILLPAQAIGEDRQGAYVFVLESTDQAGVGIVRRISVEIGKELTPEGRIEVRSGVSEGQRVVTAGVRRLVDGQRVKQLETEVPS